MSFDLASLFVLVNCPVILFHSNLFSLSIFLCLSLSLLPPWLLFSSIFLSSSLWIRAKLSISFYLYLATAFSIIYCHAIFFSLFVKERQTRSCMYLIISLSLSVTHSFFLYLLAKCLNLLCLEISLSKLSNNFYIDSGSLRGITLTICKPKSFTINLRLWFFCVTSLLMIFVTS